MYPDCWACFWRGGIKKISGLQILNIIVYTAPVAFTKAVLFDDVTCPVSMQFKYESVYLDT